MPDDYDGVLIFSVTGIERVVSAFDEDFGPLNETGRQEPSDHAEQHFLDKGRTHRPFFLEHKQCHYWVVGYSCW